VVLQGEHAEKNSTGTKHIDRRIMGVRQVIAADVFALDWVQSSDNPSDIGATFKSKVEYVRLRGMVMGYEFPRSSCTYLRDTEEKTHWQKNAKTPLPASPAGEGE
jgi:hypothetical protein